MFQFSFLHKKTTCHISRQVAVFAHRKSTVQILRNAFNTKQQFLPFQMFRHLPFL